MTSSWTERELLAFFCRCALREGHSQKRALNLWRADGEKVSDALFRCVWNEEKDRLWWYTNPADARARRLRYTDAQVTER